MVSHVLRVRMVLQRVGAIWLVVLVLYAVSGLFSPGCSKLARFLTFFR